MSSIQDNKRLKKNELLVLSIVVSTIFISSFILLGLVLKYCFPNYLMVSKEEKKVRVKASYKIQAVKDKELKQLKKLRNKSRK